MTLVCERLTTGTIVAVDRSAKMAEMAGRRNRAYIHAGREIIRELDIRDGLPAEDGSFDLAFAVNVAEFWRRPARALAAVAPRMAHGGRLLLVGEWPGAAPPGGGHSSTVALTRDLVSYGFDVEPKTMTTQGGSSVSVLRASLPPNVRAPGVPGARSPEAWRRR